MRNELPRLTLTPIDAQGTVQAQSAPGPLPTYDGPPAYLRGAGRTIPHGMPGRAEGPQNAWEQAVSQQEEQAAAETPSPSRRGDVYDAAQAFWNLMRPKRRQEAASAQEAQTFAPFEKKGPRVSFFSQKRSGPKELARQAWRDRARARGSWGRLKKSEQPKAQTPFLTTLQGQITVCVGVILLALAVRAMDSPTAQAVSSTVSDAITMEVDVDQDVGRLHFVQNLFPDTVAVWFSQKAPQSLTAPLDGRVERRFSQEYPGIGISCAGREVYACESGTVSAVQTDDLGRVSVTVAHKGGLETVYGTLSEALVEKGDRVKLGDALGLAGGTDGRYELFLQVKLDGQAVDPLPYFDGSKAKE